MCDPSFLSLPLEADWKTDHRLRAGERWMPDEKTDSCLQCRKKFSLFCRRHHCRGCGKIFCALCCPKDKGGGNRKKSKKESDSDARLCLRCTLPRCLFPQRKAVALSTASNEAVNSGQYDSTPMEIIISFLGGNEYGGIRQFTTQRHGNFHRSESSDNSITKNTAKSPSTQNNPDDSHEANKMPQQQQPAYDLRDCNALLLTCNALRRIFPLPFIPWQDSIEERFPTFRGGWARVGAGSSGEAHFCEDRQRGVFVAVKAIRKKHIYSYRTYSRLLREIDIHSSCRHPNIARLYDVFQTPTAVVLVVEAGEGRTLRSAFEVVRTSRNSRQNIEVFTGFIITEIVNALYYLLKEHHVVHRDVKPENIVLTRDFSRAMLIDFGLAERFYNVPTISHPEGTNNSTEQTLFQSVAQRFTPCGTPGFASPENIAAVVLKSSSNHPARQNGSKAPENTFMATMEAMMTSDMFSLAVVAYMMVTGRRPYRNVKSFTDMFNENRNGIVCDADYVSPACRDLITRMLSSRMPEHRLRPDEVLRHPFCAQIAQRYQRFADSRREALLMEDMEEDAEFDVVSMLHLS